MKALRIIAILLLVYVGLVAAFESLIGYFQPADQSTLVMVTFDDDGTEHRRVLSLLDHDDQFYVAANHWPRGWFRRALENPEVRAVINGTERDYLAAPVQGEEHDLIEEANRHGIGFRILTGFPPRYFVRLDPRYDRSLPTTTAEAEDEFEEQYRAQLEEADEERPEAETEGPPGTADTPGTP